MSEERNTYQKALIKKILMGKTTHPSAYDIYREMRAFVPHLSFSTVYKNLEKMSKKGEVIELNDGKKKRFDPNLDEHDHFLCVKCKKIMDLPKLSQIKEIPLPNVKIISHTTYVKGVCEDCLKKEVKDGGEDDNKNR